MACEFPQRCGNLARTAIHLLLTYSLCSKPQLHIRWTPQFCWPDLIRFQILLLPHSPASLNPSIPQFQNSFHHRHFHCLLQAWLLQLSLSQPPQVSDHLALTDPELSCVCCCQSSQIKSHHSHPSVSALAKYNRAHWIQAPFTYLLTFHLPSVLWRCWLGSRKGIWPVKNWVVGCWHGFLSGARCRLAYSPAHCLLLQ